MTEIPASHRPLLEPPTVAAFTTIGPSGYPQTSAIWFLLDGDLVRTSVHTSRQRYRNVLANPRASLFLIDPANPQRTIEVRGDAVLEDDPGKEFLSRLLAHYGHTLETFGAPTDGRRTLTLKPTRVRVTG